MMEEVSSARKRIRSTEHKDVFLESFGIPAAFSRARRVRRLIFPTRIKFLPPTMQSLLCARNGEENASLPDSSYDILSNPVEAKGGGGGRGAVHGFFSEIEECLWLRVFSAVEVYAKPSRTDPRQGPTPPHLVPLGKAVASIEEILGGERELETTSLPRKKASSRR